MSLSLRQHIQLKFKKGELPHFVIYEHCENADSVDAAILEITALKSLQHPDLLVIRPDDGSYKVDDGNLETMMKFLSQRPLEQSKKWVIWTHTEILSTTILNKLLKILEEPPLYSQILFFHEKGSPLLNTIRSRGIFFREENPIVNLEESPSFYSMHDSEAFSRAREFDEDEEKKYISALIDEPHTFLSAQKTIQEIKDLEKKRAFHQSSAHRLFRYLTLKK